MSKIEEIASTSDRQSASKLRAFGVFGVQPQNLVDLLEVSRPSSTNLPPKREINRQIPYIMNSREPLSDQRKGSRGTSQNGSRKNGFEDLTLVGRSTSQVADAGSLSSLNTSPDHQTQNYREIALPAIDVSRPANITHKRGSYQANSADKHRGFNLYEGIQFPNPDQIIAKMRERANGSGKIPPLRVEKPRLEATSFVWQVKENFDEKDREDFFVKMQKRQERNKKRQENRSKSTAKKRVEEIKVLIWDLERKFFSIHRIGVYSKKFSFD